MMARSRAPCRALVLSRPPTPNHLRAAPTQPPPGPHLPECPAMATPTDSCRPGSQMPPQTHLSSCVHGSSARPMRGRLCRAAGGPSRATRPLSGDPQHDPSVEGPVGALPWPAFLPRRRGVPRCLTHGTVHATRRRRSPKLLGLTKGAGDGSPAARPALGGSIAQPQGSP
jgi:hypothetical protein